MRSKQFWRNCLSLFDASLGFCSFDPFFLCRVFVLVSFAVGSPCLTRQGGSANNATPLSLGDRVSERDRLFNPARNPSFDNRLDFWRYFSHSSNPTAFMRSRRLGMQS